MIGAETIFDLRKQGLKPRIVFVLDLGDIRHDGWFAPADMLHNGFLPEVHIKPEDNIALLDFRFLFRCVVAVISNRKDRARLLYREIRRRRPESITVSDGTFVHHEVLA